MMLLANTFTMHKGIFFLALVTGLALAACGADAPVEPLREPLPDTALAQPGLRLSKQIET